MNFGNMFNGLFGMVEPGLCRLSMSGDIAVKTSNGYKAYNAKKGRLVNCNGFCFDVGQEFFFVIPTNHAAVGDILLVNGKPKYVTQVGKSTITVIDYEDSSVKEILPERHVFMGNTYFYGKIVSMFGNMKSGSGMKQLMKMMMFSSMFSQMSGNSTSQQGQFGNMLPMMLMMNGGDIFDGIFGDTTPVEFPGFTDIDNDSADDSDND